MGKDKTSEKKPEIKQASSGKKNYEILKSIKVDGVFYRPNKPGVANKVIELPPMSEHLIKKGFLKEVK